MNYRTPLVILAVSIASILHLVASEPVQYCKYGAETNQIDFCMGMLMRMCISINPFLISFTSRER